MLSLHHLFETYFTSSFSAKCSCQSQHSMKYDNVLHKTYTLFTWILMKNLPLTNKIFCSIQYTLRLMGYSFVPIILFCVQYDFTVRAPRVFATTFHAIFEWFDSCDGGGRGIKLMCQLCASFTFDDAEDYTIYAIRQ